MVQTSVDIFNNVNLDPEMCLSRGEGVYLQTRQCQISRSQSQQFGAALIPFKVLNIFHQNSKFSLFAKRNSWNLGFRT